MGKTDASQVGALSDYTLRPTVWMSVRHVIHTIQDLEIGLGHHRLQSVPLFVKKLL